MIRFFVALMGAVAIIALAPSVARAGNPHFISCTATVNGDTVTVNGKEAGLGDEAQVHIVLTATAVCINGGSNHPKAVNKDDLASAEDVPVQNGKADYDVSATATFQPDCTPPMTVEISNITLEDETNGIFCALH